MTFALITLFAIVCVGACMYASGEKNGYDRAYEEINKIANESVKVTWITLPKED